MATAWTMSVNMRGFQFTGTATTTSANSADFVLICNTTGDQLTSGNVSWAGATPNNTEIANWSAGIQRLINNYVGARVPG
jgi:hypothetical protein